MFGRNIVFIFVIAIIVAFLGLLVFGLTRQEPATGASGAARINRPAPDFSLTLFNGGQFTLSRLKGKPVVINFWASWCIPCREEAPLLEKVWRNYKDKGIVFVGIAIQDKEADALAFIREFDLTYPNGPDTRGKITVDYGVSGIPVTFFVNREGQIMSRWVGAINERLLVNRIEEIMR